MGEGPRKYSPLPIQMPVIVVHVSARTRISAGAVRHAVETAKRVGKEPCCDIARDLHTQVAVWHEIRGKTELDEAVVGRELQSLEANRALELAGLHDKPRLESCIGIGVENDGLAVCEIRDEPIVENLVDRAIDIRTYLPQQPRIGSARRTA